MDTKYLLPEGNVWRVRIPVANSKVGCGSYPYEQAIQVRDEALKLAAPTLVQGNGWTAEGLTVECGDVDEEAVVARAIRESVAAKIVHVQSQAQQVRFDAKRVCLVALGDQHCGGMGVDYERLFDEAKVIAEEPHFFALTMGDMLDNFIIAKLQAARMHSRFTITDEWALVRRYVRTLAPKLVGVVEGNHDRWTELLSSVPYYRETMARIAPHALFDANDLWMQVHVGGHSWRVRARHRWAGNSIYNPTHGIERAARWDNDFDIGIGAHAHVGGCVRTFNVGEQRKLAAMVGTYKSVDLYPRQKGLARAGDATAVALVFNGETGVVTGYDSLAEAVCVIRGACDTM